MARLAELTTLRLGGQADRLVEATSEAQLVDVVAAADRAGEPLLVLGGGSNVVVTDEGVAGTVVLVRTRGLTVDTDPCAGASVEVAAGESWDGLVARAVAEGWQGLECLSGIPGLVGASPIQNIGAYGQEVADTIARVRTYDRSRSQVRTFAADDLGLGYRTSRFKREPGRFVVLAVTFQLALGATSGPIRYQELADELGVAVGERVPLADARTAVLAVRRRKGMVLDPADHDTWSAGSFFVNPVLPADAFDALRLRMAALPGPDVVLPGHPAPDGAVKTSAAWLIARAGFARGHARGRAAISTKHTLALTNRGGATAAELLALADEVRDGVERAFGVRLQLEPVVVGRGTSDSGATPTSPAARATDPARATDAARGTDAAAPDDAGDAVTEARPTRP